MLLPGASSLLASLRALLRDLGDPRDLADVAGLTSLAFRIQIDPASRRMKGGVSRGLEGQVAGY